MEDNKISKMPHKVVSNTYRRNQFHTLHGVCMGRCSLSLYYYCHGHGGPRHVRALPNLFYIQYPHDILQNLSDI
jgi:hypothetical protein